jgi:hypothetical protein
MSHCLKAWGLPAVGLWIVAAFAVSSPLAAQTPDLIGTGPRVDVQTGPNGTLDVGGPRGTDVNMTGENFRGSFGASRSSTGATTSPGLPANLFSNPAFKTPFFAPDFGLSLPAASSRQEVHARTGSENSGEGYTDLILPRFRADLASSPAKAGSSAGDAWRYRFSGGRWWYWLPSKAWTYWDGGQWRPYAQR